MNSFILFVVLIGSNGQEYKKPVSEHSSLLSCKADQANYQDLENRIKYYCAKSNKVKNI